MHIKDLVVPGNARVLGDLRTRGALVSVEGHTHSYLPLSGGTLTGKLICVSEQYSESTSYSAQDTTKFGIDMRNSDIMGCNALYFKDASDSCGEGLNFYKASGVWHTIRCKGDGTFIYNPNRNAQAEGTTVFSITSGGAVSAASYNASSDLRLKENLRELPKTNILDLPLYKFDFITGPKNQIGCLAQDLQKICPEIVSENINGYLTIQESKIVYLLLDETKKLKAELEDCKRELKELQVAQNKNLTKETPDLCT